MKTLYMLYAIIFKGISVLRIADDWEQKDISWNAYNLPLDESCCHNGKWAEGDTPQEAVWNLRIKMKKGRSDSVI